MQQPNLTTLEIHSGIIDQHPLKWIKENKRDERMAIISYQEIPLTEADGTPLLSKLKEWGWE